MVFASLNYGLYPVRGPDVFRGPFHVPRSSPKILVVDTTYDAATPYRGGKRLARDLGSTRLLTMRGDNHTAYQGNSPCIDQKVEAYLIDLDLPPVGTKCNQEVPFEAPQAAQARAQSLSVAHAPQLPQLLRARPMR